MDSLAKAWRERDGVGDNLRGRCGRYRCMAWTKRFGYAGWSLAKAFVVEGVESDDLVMGKVNDRSQEIVLYTDSRTSLEC